ncbi:MAG: TonB-dependent siderophore receptor [Gammaproteobacteria bacterium]|nr:MAG: TonB-dependent siderophore receptor [Gammaproteobacteria bacterium]
MKDKKYRAGRVLLSAVVLQAPLLAMAAEDTAGGVEEVIVTGSVLGQSLPEEVRVYPGNRSILSAQQLQQNASRSIDDALQRVPGIKVQDETGTGVLPNVAVRGLNASRSGYTQFLVDGVPLTLAPYGHTGQSLFPAVLKSLDRIDIVRGGAAVQYGPNNVGGVINLISKPIPEDWQTSFGEKMTVFEGGNALNDHYLRTGGRINDRFALQLEGNLIDGESFRDHSDTEVENWQLKARWSIDEQKTLDTTFQYYNADTEMPGALTTEAYRDDRDDSQRPNDEFQGDTLRFSARYNQQFGAFGAADAGEFNWVTFGHKSTRNFQWDFSTDPSADHWADPDAPATLLRSSPREFHVWGTEPSVSFLFDGDRVSHKITLGSRLVQEKINYKLKQTNIATNVTSVPRDWRLDTTAVAAYISDEISMLDGRLTVTPGLRYENVDMEFDDVGKNTGDDNRVTEELPGLTIGYETEGNWFFYGNAQRSLRVPQIAVIRGTSDEGAELAWNYEMGFRYQPSATGSLGFSVYRIDFEDQLIYNSTKQSFDNVGETRHRGFELEGRYSPDVLPRLSLHLAYNYLDSEQDEGANKGNELPYASKHQVIWDATYAMRDLDVTLSGFYFSSAYSDQANTKEETPSGTTGELPSYTVWNLQLSKETPMGDGASLYTGLSFNNLFDKEYYFRGIDVSPSGRYPAPPRSVSLELKYVF